MRSKLLWLAVLIGLTLGLPMPLSAAEIPLGTSGGVYTVAGQVNGSVTLQFLVDPGAGVVVIPVAVLRTLAANGSVTQDDVIGIGAAELADNSAYLMARVRLRELRIGNTIVRDVTAAVSPGLRQPLLGQSFFRKFASVTFDNQRQMMVLSDNAAPSVAQAPATAWIAPYPSYPSAVPYPYSGGSYSAPAYQPGYGR